MIENTKKTIDNIRRDDIDMSDRDIIRKYLGIDQLPCKLQSPIRSDDEKPSFAMMERDGVVYWKDFGTGETGNAVSLMAKIWNVSYNDALIMMKHDTGDIIPHVNFTKTNKGRIHYGSESKLKVKVRKWRSWDKEFWGSFGIPVEFASWCNVFPISHSFFITEKDGIKNTVDVPMDKYAYAYFEWKDNTESIKLYQPYSKTMKWISKHNASVWDLWKHAFLFAKNKSSRDVIITSSRKDAMCLWYNLGVPCMSLQGEGYIPKPKVMQQVIDTFDNVYIWYDNDFSHKNDNPGQDNAKKIIGLYPSLINICIPEYYQSKDPSDLFKNKGLNTLKDVWNRYRVK